MNRPLYLMLLLLLLLGTSVTAEEKVVKSEFKSPYQIIDEAPAIDWRSLDLNNTLYITLKTGVVVVELAPQFAPNHVENTKNLVREGVFNNTSFYRVIDGFVAQGGPAEPEKIIKPKNGNLSIDAEFTITKEKPLSFTPLNGFDGYAPEVGYVDGFAAGRSKDKKSNWLLHCYGAFAMGRGNNTDSGGTELYVVIGTAQRYLDKNTTVFGRVITGMKHIQALERSTTLQGEVDVKTNNKILKVQVASDVNFDKRLPLQVLKTDSNSFKALIESRKNRKSEWFLYQHDYIDVCSVAVPVRLALKEKD
jgi:peptidylprolyl isomerase